MDTNTALQTLISLQSTLQSNVKGQQAQVDALTVAVGIIQGTLATQLSSVTDEQFSAFSQTSVLKGQLDETQAQLVATEATVADLQNSVATLELNNPVSVKPLTP